MSKWEVDLSKRREEPLSSESYALKRDEEKKKGIYLSNTRRGRPFRRRLYLFLQKEGGDREEIGSARRDCESHRKGSPIELEKTSYLGKWEDAGRCKDGRSSGVSELVVKGKKKKPALNEARRLMRGNIIVRRVIR